MDFPTLEIEDSNENFNKQSSTSSNEIEYQHMLNYKNLDKVNLKEETNNKHLNKCNIIGNIIGNTTCSQCRKILV